MDGQQHNPAREFSTNEDIQSQTTSGIETRLLLALHSSKCIEGLTHNFYRYPARMLPDLAREIICNFTAAGDIVLDPFMGGGTTIVEAVAAGRQAVGIDINSLAVFIANAKTTPLSPKDEQLIQQWSVDLDFSEYSINSNVSEVETRTKNMPLQLLNIFNQLLLDVNLLPYPRQRQFARCCLLRLGQWAIDGKDIIPNSSNMREKFVLYVQEMLSSLHEFVITAQAHGITKKRLIKQRTLLLRSAVDAQTDEHLRQFIGKPTLVVTSPPYPSVHVLYHRWQVAGRRETPAPYWFIGANDGQGASFYTLGSRSQLGQDNYFHAVTEVFRSVRSIAHPKAPVVQLVSFFDVDNQLPTFLQAMEQAGYEEFCPIGANHTNFWRTVPNRKWYNRIDAARGSGQELLLFHRPRY